MKFPPNVLALASSGAVALSGATSAGALPPPIVRPPSDSSDELAPRGVPGDARRPADDATDDRKGQEDETSDSNDGTNRLKVERGNFEDWNDSVRDDYFALTGRASQFGDWCGWGDCTGCLGFFKEDDPDYFRENWGRAPGSLMLRECDPCDDTQNWKLDETGRFHNKAMVDGREVCMRMLEEDASRWSLSFAPWPLSVAPCETTAEFVFDVEDFVEGGMRGVIMRDGGCVLPDGDDNVGEGAVSVWDCGENWWDPRWEGKHPCAQNPRAHCCSSQTTFGPGQELKFPAKQTDQQKGHFWPEENKGSVQGLQRED